MDNLVRLFMATFWLALAAANFSAAIKSFSDGNSFVAGLCFAIGLLATLNCHRDLQSK